MSDSLYGISKMFESTIRLQIIASLTVETLSFVQLKRICQISDGHLQMHIKNLCESNYITATKGKSHGKRLTTYELTEQGRTDFEKFMQVLMQSMQPQQEKEKEGEAQ